MELDTVDASLHHPFGMVIAASSGAGKTMFCKCLLKNLDNLVDKPIHSIHYHYACWQPLYEEMQRGSLGDHIVFRNDLPHPEEELCSASGQIYNQENRLYVIDDRQRELSERKAYLDQLFSRTIHHCNCSVILLLQDLYYKNIRCATINSNYVVLLQNKSNELACRTLCAQTYCGPERSRLFWSAYNKCMTKPYGYLLVDRHPGTDERIRLRTDIFPNSNGDNSTPDGHMRCFADPSTL